ncbi:unnamed protein product, partial [marine sediment metagenome]
KSWSSKPISAGEVSLSVGQNEMDIVDKLEFLIRERESISKEILVSLAKYKKQEGAVIRNYLRKYRNIEDFTA